LLIYSITTIDTNVISGLADDDGIAGSTEIETVSII